MNRGDRREAIFNDDKNRLLFLDDAGVDSCSFVHGRAHARGFPVTSSGGESPKQWRNFVLTPLRVLLEMKDFHGWDSSGLWEDIKFDLKHFSGVERVAMVGEKEWQKGMSQFCRPFTTAKVRYFDQSALDEARQWAEAA